MNEGGEKMRANERSLGMDLSMLYMVYTYDSNICLL